MQSFCKKNALIYRLAVFHVFLYCKYMHKKIHRKTQSSFFAQFDLSNPSGCLHFQQYLFESNSNFFIENYNKSAENNYTYQKYALTFIVVLASLYPQRLRMRGNDVRAGARRPQWMTPHIAIVVKSCCMTQCLYLEMQ